MQLAHSYTHALLLLRVSSLIMIKGYRDENMRVEERRGESWGKDDKADPRRKEFMIKGPLVK